jgi:DNA-binding transcriptional MerR regulator
MTRNSCTGCGSIRRCRALGFTLDQITRSSAALDALGRGAPEVDRITANHLKDIQRKVSDLRRLATELRRINKRCPGKGLICQVRHSRGAIARTKAAS